MAFSAFLDTCVLVPSRQRDVLLQVALGRIFRPLWSSEIIRELDYTLRRLLKERGAATEETDAYLARLHQQMESSFPDAVVTGWEQVMGTIDLPDPNDRHVVAAALLGRADVIVTENSKDFPLGSLPHPLFTQTSDEFLLDSLDLDSKTVVAAVKQVAARSGRNGPALSPLQVADHLKHTSAPKFGTAISEIFG